MPIKSFTPGRLEIVARAERPIRLGGRVGGRTASPAKKLAFINQGKRRRANEYHCAIERTQNGKYNVRLRALFGTSPTGGESAASSTHHRTGWTVSAYFLASSFNVAMKKLAQSLQCYKRMKNVFVSGVWSEATIPTWLATFSANSASGSTVEGFSPQNCRIQSASPNE